MIKIQPLHCCSKPKLGAAVRHLLGHITPLHTTTTLRSQHYNKNKMGWRDEWPSMPDGKQYDGKKLLTLVSEGKSPFEDVWNVTVLVEEIQEKLNTQVIDIPEINKGSNNYGFYLKTLDQRDMIARLARGDVNMPDFDGFAIEKQIPEAHFEAAVYQLLHDEPNIRASRLLYYRAPARKGRDGNGDGDGDGDGVGKFSDNVPKDISGRRLFVFEKADGENNVWGGIRAENKLVLIDQLAVMRAALFRYYPPFGFVAQYLHSRTFDFKPASLSLPVAPTREFWMHVLESKIKATIGNQGDMIGWEDDEETVGPIAFAAKQSLLRALPHILPLDDSDAEEGGGSLLYRFVLDHGDFGIHNTSITIDENTGEPLITSLYDWETGCIVPAILSDPLVAAGPVDLIADANAEPSVTRLPEDSSACDLDMYAVWSQRYFEKLYYEAPNYKSAIAAGKHARYLWFALRDWHGGNSEEFFGGLGRWADEFVINYNKSDADAVGVESVFSVSEWGSR